jgi:predicted dehydrogenase
VCDLNNQKLAPILRQYPGVVTTTDFHEVLRDGRIEAVAIATPVHSHFELCLDALRAGKHVLVEKPMAETSEQAKRQSQSGDIPT